MPVLSFGSYVDKSGHMDEDAAIAALAALAQPTRLRVFRMLIKAGLDGLPAGAIAEAEAVPHNTMSTHLAVLARAGLVQSRRESRSIIYAANIERIGGLLTFLVADCCAGHPDVCAPLEKAARNARCAPGQAKATRGKRHAGAAV
jgi:ArsR family transcriptional regulator